MQPHSDSKEVVDLLNSEVLHEVLVPQLGTWQSHVSLVDEEHVADALVGCAGDSELEVPSPGCVFVVLHLLELFGLVELSQVLEHGVVLWMYVLGASGVTDGACILEV